MSEEYDTICECHDDMKCHFDEIIQNWICFPFDTIKKEYYRRYIEPKTGKCYVSYIENGNWTEWILFEKK
jgi:hypothetical protein